jgi:hypothetical protein
MSNQSAACYSGNLLPGDACGLLAGGPESTLIDVRTQAERGYIGVPVSPHKGNPLLGSRKLSFYVKAGLQPWVQT